MANILNKPYTDKDYADFAVIANSNGQRTEQSDTAVYALYPYEKLQNCQIVDISETEDYKAKIAAEQNAIKKVELQAQINDLDTKSIRAMREPEVKDATSGQTWLDYFTEQIKDLRTQIAGL